MNNIKNIINTIIIISKEILLYCFYYQNYNKTIINILDNLGDYNIVYSKIFQWVCIENNNNNSEILERIKTYTNKIPYKNSDIEYKDLLKLYTIADINLDKLEITELRPINTGTVSLVFKAKLNNEYIAIKILRKNIVLKINEGVNFLIFLSNIIKYIPYLNMFMFDKIISENKINIIKQTNFINEIENIELFYNCFKKHKYVIVPKVYKNYTTELNNIIIMDFIDGKNINELNGEEKDFYLISYIKFCISSIFIKKIIHSDLHQGNIIFCKSIQNNEIIYKVGIIDLGMIIKLNINEINFIYSFLINIFNCEFYKIIEYLDDNKDFLIENINLIDYNKAISELKQLHNDNKLFNTTDINNVINEIPIFLNVIKKYNGVLKNNLYCIILSFIPSFYIVKNLKHNLDFSCVFKDEIKKIYCNKLFD